MPDFFASGTPLLIFYSMAILASIVLVIQIVLMLFGFDGDGDVGLEDLGESEGLGFLSVRSVTGFFGGFGWMGVIMLENGSALPVAIAAGVGVGGVLMLSGAYLMKMLYSLRESGTIDFENAIGQVGTVYLPVPANESGPGDGSGPPESRHRVHEVERKDRQPEESEGDRTSGRTHADRRTIGCGKERRKGAIKWSPYPRACQ